MRLAIEATAMAHAIQTGGNAGFSAVESTASDGTAKAYPVTEAGA